MYHNIKRKRLGSYHGEYTKFPTTNKQTTKNTHNGPTWTLTSQNAPSHVVLTNLNSSRIPSKHTSNPKILRSNKKKSHPHPK